MDIQKTWMLLQIAESSLKFPNLNNIHVEAMAELTAIANTPPAPQAAPSKPVPVERKI